MPPELLLWTKSLPAPPSGRSRSISLTALRSPKSLVRPAVRIDAMCLPSHLDLRLVWCGGLWHRRCCSAMATCSGVTFLMAVPPVLVAGLRHPARSQRERTRREDRRLKFYGLRGMLGCLYSSSHCNLLSFASTSATIERRQPCPRMSRRPVTTSQTSHAARPATPTNSSGEPSAMARFPAPAKMSKLPPATPSSRCHGRDKPLA